MRKPPKTQSPSPETKESAKKESPTLLAGLDPTLRIEDAQDEADEELETYLAMLRLGLVTMPTDGSTLH